MDYRTRAQWGATYNPSGRKQMTLPVELVFIHHNVMIPTNNPNADMLATEKVDIARFGCPSYKWAIHPSGVILEGMTTHDSPDTYGHNSDSISIMFMGNFENARPTDAAMLAGRQLIQLLSGWHFLTASFKLLGHRDVYATACPGANLYPRINELLVPVFLPAPMPSPKQIRKDNNMVIQDPTTGGYWVAYDNGAIASYDGAPYLGGTNNTKLNVGSFPCVGIGHYIDNKGEGYCLVLDFGPAPGNTGDRFRRYRFPRDGSARV